MSGGAWVRPLHRWTSLAFTLSVIANFVAIAAMEGGAPAWVTYSPLGPLAVLMFSGAYLFVVPYLARTGRQG